MLKLRNEFTKKRKPGPKKANKDSIDEVKKSQLLTISVNMKLLGEQSKVKEH